MYYVGIDIGSTASKTVVTGDREMKFVLPTGWSSKETASEIASRLLDQGIDVMSEGVRVAATGYGRVAVDYADFVITEITCHGRGGRELAGNECAIIDVGGQDTKVILIDQGMIQDFLMNDKCSEGTGRFLEMMAKTMEMSLDELSQVGLSYQEDITISSMCTVFAESEVVSLIAQNKHTDDIVHGLNKAVAAKTASLVKRVGGEEAYMMTGGVAQNKGLVKTLEERLGTSLVISPKSQLCGALGAALYGLEGIF